MSIEALVPRMRVICGAGNVVTDPLELRTYECDGLTAHRCVPALVVLPSSAIEVAAVVAACASAGVPFVARGSGTGLSGGALPHKDGVLIVMSRMRSICEIDAVSRRAVVEPGVTNLAVSKAAAPFGLFYAPDPSSQVVCSVGGNVAENSGGAHCLKHGFTVHHVMGLEVVAPDGELTWLGDGTGVTTGYDLLGAFTGSEGTLGIVTKIVVKLMPLPEVVHLLLVAYDTTSRGGQAVSDIIGAGILPAAIEMMDALAIEAAEEAVHCNYPAGAGAVLLVELDGPAAEVEAELTTVRSLCEAAGATEIRAADDPAERAGIWAGRKSAFAAVGRISPAYIVQDGVVPRTSLGAVLAQIASLSAASGIRVANVFHAGDGNLHPLVLYDDAVPGQAEAAEEVSGAILDACLAHGGSITGEHGVGVDKSRYMPKMFNADDLDTMQLLRCAFDPVSLCNPGKVFPTPRLCGEVPGHRRAAHPAVVAGQAEIFLYGYRTEVGFRRADGAGRRLPGACVGFCRGCRGGRGAVVRGRARFHRRGLRLAAGRGVLRARGGAARRRHRAFVGLPAFALRSGRGHARDEPGARARGRRPGGAGAGRRDDRAAGRGARRGPGVRPGAGARRPGRRDRGRGGGHRHGRAAAVPLRHPA
jgi:glycolate dehydrogenase FAD-linked subunit